MITVTSLMMFITGILMEWANYQEPKGCIFICTAIILVYLPKDKS